DRQGKGADARHHPRQVLLGRGGHAELARAPPLRRVHLRLLPDRPQGAGIAVGRRLPLRRKLRVSRGSSAVALYRCDAGEREDHGGDVEAPGSSASGNTSVNTEPSASLVWLDSPLSCAVKPPISRRPMPLVGASGSKPTPLSR